MNQTCKIFTVVESNLLSFNEYTANIVTIVIIDKHTIPILI